MIKAIVIYDTRHGNTKTVAEGIVQGIGASGGIETELCFVEDVEMERIPEYDIVVIGAPNHYGKPSKTTKEFVKKLKELELEGKKFAAFDTCLRRQEGKAFGWIEKRMRRMFRSSQVISPGLSILVGGTKGPILEGELPKCEKFGKMIAEA